MTRAIKAVKRIWEKDSARLTDILYYAAYVIIALSLLFKQPFGNPPDEYNRFLIPSYIAEHGTLPNGYEEEIRIPGYGFSYAFQPILPYMAQGYAMRLVGLFTQDAPVLLYTARLVNFLFGLIQAYFVRKLANLWFSDKRFATLFCFLVLFLPQSIFVHTYVNTDSCCMMSIAILLYGLTKGLKGGFDFSSISSLSVGIILCALSYYNAYGFILSAILLFTASFLSRKEGRLHFAVRDFMRIGGLISILVLLGIGWWFIRCAVLYDGDFLGLKTRDACASLYALPAYHPATRVTWQSQGFSVFDMLTKSDFVTLSGLSFIGIYGPMNIITALWIYRMYKYLFWCSILIGAILSVLRRQELPFLTGRRCMNRFFHANMIFCILMPCILSVVYSYRIDYQPQGRYLLPALFPFMLYCTRGLEAIVRTFLDGAKRHKPAAGRLAESIATGLCSFLILMVLVSLCVTVYGYAYPVYTLGTDSLDINAFFR